MCHIYIATAMAVARFGEKDHEGVANSRRQDGDLLVNLLEKGEKSSLDGWATCRRLALRGEGDGGVGAFTLGAGGKGRKTRLRRSGGRRGKRLAARRG